MGCPTEYLASNVIIRGARKNGEDLWHDIIVRGGEPAHYMGYLVLQTSDNRNFDIIDGQQRLTTLSLIVLAAMKLIKELIAQDYYAADNQKRLDQLRASYIGYLDPVTLTTSNELTLNRNNDDYYRNYLATLADHPPQRGFPTSTLTMRKSFLWFERRLRDHIANAADRGKELASFGETMSDKLFFTVITVADELNAYRVFETLNARGVRLSATDLLKTTCLLFWPVRRAATLMAWNDAGTVLLISLAAKACQSFLERIGTVAISSHANQSCSR
ncbi:DUF262 domain-containing protein [Chloroflexus sp.]|uniref:DUF262 domain-containing protein n=1 Tax=Chloroflexus sp. TaxID=1904827 RepID=UPI002ACE9863|nr:DUF262 domain-containing protein [Chloroflexus sp.]